MVEFNVARMRATVAKDEGLAFFLQHMKDNGVGKAADGTPATEDFLLQILFNSEVADNACMIRLYKKVKVAA